MESIKKSKILYIESLRGISCLIVLFAHIISTSPKFGIYASGCGKIGVWLFMLLSGYLLLQCYVVDGSKEFKIRDIPKYYLRKIIRLYPMYMVVLTLSVILGIITFKSLIKHLLLLEAYGHFWYMPVIIKFYIIAPIFLVLFSYIKKKFNKDKALYIFTFFIFILTILFSICFPFTKYIENSIKLYWYMPVFLIGMLIACSEGYTYKKFEIMSIITLILAIIGIVIVTPLSRKILFNIEPSKYLQNKYIYMTICWGFILYGIKNIEKLNNFFNKATILQKLGSISFEIYLIHYIILMKLEIYNIRFSIKAILTIIITIILSIIIHYIDKKVKLIILKNK